VTGFALEACGRVCGRGCSVDLHSSSRHDMQPPQHSHSTNAMWSSCCKHRIAHNSLHVLAFALALQVVADGVVTESFGLVLDEASLTGESDPIKKNEEDPWCRSGTQVGGTAGGGWGVVWTQVGGPAMHPSSSSSSSSKHSSSSSSSAKVVREHQGTDSCRSSSGGRDVQQQSKQGLLLQRCHRRHLAASLSAACAQQASSYHSTSWYHGGWVLCCSSPAV
jgi:hypothetical protein